MLRESLKVRTLIGVERFLIPILLRLVTPRSVPTLTSAFVPAHAITFFRALAVALPPTLPRTFALTATEPMAGNAYEKPVMPGEAPPDGNLVFAFIVRNQALFAGTALKRNPELFLRKLKVPRRRPHAP